MSPTLYFVVYAALVNWVLIVVASLIRTQGWTLPGMILAFGNRDNLPAPSALAGRAERAARNMLENLVLFTALALTAHVAGLESPRVELGAAVFFWARVAYIPIYLIGLAYARTTLWAVSLVGLGMILSVFFST